MIKSRKSMESVIKFNKYTRKLYVGMEIDIDMKEKNRKFSPNDFCEMMPELNPERQLSAWEYITKIPNAVLLAAEEKERLCTKLELDHKKPRLLVIGMVLFLLSGFLEIGLIYVSFYNIINGGPAIIILEGLAIGILFFIWILGMYLIQLYYEQKREGRNIHKCEVYRVPVMPYISIRDGRYIKVRYYIQVSGGKELLFFEPFQISREQYQALDRFSFYAYYYEGKRKNDNRKYKVYVIGEKRGGE